MPIILPANQPRARFYRGGPQIDRFRGTEGHKPTALERPPAYEPEDWVASTTPCHGCRPLGLTTLPDGRLLSDAVAADPDHWLGPAHVAAFGADTKVLVKLLDAGQRLPVHAHPDGQWARTHVPHATHGKAEAWYMLTEGEVWLGLQEDVSLKELGNEVHAQDVDRLLGRLHCFTVQPHDTVYVPPGFLHAIGEGVLVVEVQEPSDLSVLLEWKGFAIDGANQGHLGVGWDTALTAVDRTGRSRQEIKKLLVSPSGTAGEASTKSVLASSSRSFFRLEHVIVVNGEAHTLEEQGFAVVIVLEGNVVLSSAGADPGMRVEKGNTILVSHADGYVVLTGAGKLLVARPPLP
ncbi:hypothetical protein SCUCBS95973_008824 [Sporothrix curviconia]|uniref:Mannose-6-phosphate isomerase n=1 Tax=Sporothrix curviconia TaxID=1260050 RepID=A0ABP0CSQ6_9PEZI